MRGVCQKGKIFPVFFSGTLPLAVVLYHILKARIDRAGERFFNGHCHHSQRWWRCQLNLTPGIHIGHEPANKYRRRNSIDAPSEISAGDIWRNLATMSAEKSVCETWKIHGRVSAPWLHPVTGTPVAIVKIAAMGRLLGYYALILEYFWIFLPWNWWNQSPIVYHNSLSLQGALILALILAYQPPSHPLMAVI